MYRLLAIGGAMLLIITYMTLIPLALVRDALYNLLQGTRNAAREFVTISVLLTKQFEQNAPMHEVQNIYFKKDLDKGP